MLATSAGRLRRGKDSGGCGVGASGGIAGVWAAVRRLAAADALAAVAVAVMCVAAVLAQRLAATMVAARVRTPQLLRRRKG